MNKEFIFLFSPLNSGTTVISQYIASLLNNSYLPPFGNNEGQNAPKLKTYFPSNRWKANNNYDWNFVKEVWTELLEESNKSIFIEASPPNMIEVDNIFKCFKPKHFLFSISSPYSFIGSTIYNYGKNKRLTNDRLDRACKRWIQLAKIQISNISKYGYSKEMITYERFCSNPDSLIDILFKSQEEKDLYINKVSDKKIKGKNNDKLSEIVDMQPKHLTFLGAKNIIYISEKLSPYKDVLDFFHYDILTVKDVNNIIKDNLIIALDGIERRIKKSSKLEIRNKIRINKKNK